MMEYKLKNNLYLAIKLEALYDGSMSREEFVKSKRQRSLSIPERREAMSIADILVWEIQG